MKKLSLFLMATAFFSVSAQADICGIVKKHEFELVRGLVNAQIKQSPTRTVTVKNQYNRTSLNVKSVELGKEGHRLSDGVYYDLIMKTESGEEVTVDIGYMYLVTADGKNALNLARMTACGVFYAAGPAVIDMPTSRRASSRSINGNR